MILSIGEIINQRRFVFKHLIHIRLLISEIEDICQEVFIKVFKNLAGFGFQSKLSTWIARIAYLTAINHLKKCKKTGITIYPTDMGNFHFTNETPEQALTKQNTSAYTNLLIGKMPEQYRTVLTLYHLNEFSYLEIEQIKGAFFQ